MKLLLLALFVTFQMIISSVALAWSPLDSLDAAVESMQHCYSVVASSEEEEALKKKKKLEGEEEEEEEEEEPDCD